MTTLSYQELDKNCEASHLCKRCAHAPVCKAKQVLDDVQNPNNLFIVVSQCLCYLPEP